MRSLQDVAIEMGLVEVPAGRTRSRYGRITAPGSDSSAAEVRAAESFFAVMWLFMVTSAVATVSGPWRLLFVLAACFTTLVLARIDDLRRSAKKHASK